MVLGLLWACSGDHPRVPAAGTTHMTDVTIEQRGGFVGAGGPDGHVHMRGLVVWSALSAADRATIDTLFAERRPVNANLYYHLTRSGPHGPESVDALPDQVPQALLASVHTTLD